MKKLYRKGTVHPSPPVISDQLSFLPATILTLTAALSPEDREVLAYLISCSSNNNATPPAFSNFSGNPRRSANKNAVAKGAVDGGDHAPLFHCSCFRCYMSYWVRWDSSPNRQLIHEIIDAFEDWLAQSSKGGKNGNGKKEKKNKKGSNKQSGELNRPELVSPAKNESDESESVGKGSSSGGEGSSSGGAGQGGGGVEDEEKGSVRRFVSFLGERIWGAWGQ